MLLQADFAFTCAAGHASMFQTIMASPDVLGEGMEDLHIPPVPAGGTL